MKVENGTQLVTLIRPDKVRKTLNEYPDGSMT